MPENDKPKVTSESAGYPKPPEKPDGNTPHPGMQYLESGRTSNADLGQIAGDTGVQSSFESLARAMGKATERVLGFPVPRYPDQGTAQSTPKKERADSQRSSNGFSMSRDDAIFWIGITLFGAGVYLMADHPVYGLILFLIGVGLLIWANRGHMPKPPLRMALLVIAMMLTLAAVAFDIYDRNFGTPQIVRKEPSLPQQKVVVAVTPEYLMSLYESKMSSQGDRLFGPYIGKFIHVSQTVEDTKLNSVWTYIRKPNTVPRPVVLFFDFPRWSDAVEVLVKGQSINALCQIAAAKSDEVVLIHCELQ